MRNRTWSGPLGWIRGSGERGLRRRGSRGRHPGGRNGASPALPAASTLGGNGEEGWKDMTSVYAVGYVVVTGPVQEWRRFGTEVLGAQVVDDDADGSGTDQLRLRTDERAYRVVVQEGPAAGAASLVALGFETTGAAGLDELVGALAAHGVATREDPELAARRQVRRLVCFTDPDGTAIEAFYGQASDHRPFVSPRGVRFVTGELGVGHTFRISQDAGKAAAFYTDVLGFRLSDTIDFGVAQGIFLHCNPRHHSVAFATFPGAPSGLGHLMLEVDRLDAVGRALDVAQSGPEPVVMSMGEHTNDLMTSFYVKTPSGFDIEYGWNGRLIDDAEWTVGHYDSASTWGHHVQAGARA